jgi:uncharacterized protein YjiS (DUF1127 family)
MDTISVSRRPSLTAALRRAATFGGAVLRVAAMVLVEWEQRLRERDMLRSLDEHALKDLGVTRDAIQREAEKPFWRV